MGCEAVAREPPSCDVMMTRSTDTPACVASLTLTSATLPAIGERTTWATSAKRECCRWDSEYSTFSLS